MRDLCSWGLRETARTVRCMINSWEVSLLGDYYREALLLSSFVLDIPQARQEAGS